MVAFSFSDALSTPFTFFVTGGPSPAAVAVKQRLLMLKKTKINFFIEYVLCYTLFYLRFGLMNGFEKK
ncbi:MAG: hypothetical protein C0582_02885 [Alphaproteobacteria bacterium]|nr:MAG: hypothetical protein C0582_02885 [Alphaproteobacteria bacterium]